MIRKTWYGELYDEPGVRRSVLVWLLFGVPGVILSRLTWLESVLWWLVLGLISFVIAGVTVGIVQVTSRVETPDRASSAGVALVASMTTWAIAWLLILSTLVPEHAAGRSTVDISWSLVGLAILGAVVLVMGATISTVFASSEHGVRGASWIWARLAGRDSFAEWLSGHLGLTLALMLSVVALTGWLWLLTQATRLAFLYAGWSR
ncbi:MAG TPA: hypothetical protein VMS64_30410 [Candidatus Methylomirabilis sp.]|nr:hypothetical protein [Candidatus Methylomirabilis sp.]